MLFFQRSNSNPTVTVNLLLEDTKPLKIPYANSLTAEEVCRKVCRELHIRPISQYLFGLRVGKGSFLPPHATITLGDVTTFEFRLRFKTPSIGRLKENDERAYNYYFQQVRQDILNKEIRVLVDQYPNELVGLAITDIYRTALEKKVSIENVRKDYKKFFPKAFMWEQMLLVKRNVYDKLAKLRRSGASLDFIKSQYLQQVENITPEYPCEQYKVMYEVENQQVQSVIIKVVPPTSNKAASIKYHFDLKNAQLVPVCDIEDLGYIILYDKFTISLDRLDCLPIRLTFASEETMWSFVTLINGYYRLSCKWAFNLCKELETPNYKNLYRLKSHGPVGGQFSYAKLELKGHLEKGCFILRESEADYDVFYIDVCTQTGSKPKTLKLQKNEEEDYLFDNQTQYKSVKELIDAHKNPEAEIYLKECLAPSEYDDSPLLLCKIESNSDSLLKSSALLHLSSTPALINYKDLQKFQNRKSNGPWCYTVNSDLIDETCALPLCSYSECRLTGPGMEYGGAIDKGVSGRTCLKWDKERKKVLVDGTYVKLEKFADSKFPDTSRAKAKNYCRNPDGNSGGPWCFVSNEELGYIEKEFCDIPFCYDPECSVFAKNYTSYTHYTDFNGSVLTDIKFGLKLWDSDEFSEGSARLVLSTLALPLTGQEIGDLGIGIEVFISNTQSALRYGNKDQPEYEPTPGILTSTNFTTFTLNWDRGFITFGVEGRTKPIFLAEIKTKGNLLGYHKDRFDFYSVQGSNVMWSFPFCLDDDECDVQTTTGPSFQQFWPLRQKDIVFDLQFHVRAFRSAAVLITPSPTVDYPYFKLVLLGPNGHTRVTCKEYATASEIVLKEIQLESIVDYWEWNEFSISFFANSLQIYMKKAIGMHSLLETSNEMFRLLRWFSVSSDDSVAHWSFFCQPPRFARPPTAVLPECTINTNEPDYSGTQDVTSAGLPCLPWSGKKLLPAEATKLFKNESAALAARNYCRNPRSAGEGTFCYTVRDHHPKNVSKEYCHLRKCKSQQCKIAGTGNDYLGTTATTRSGRKCDKWDIGRTSVHPKYMSTFNGSYFADMNSAAAKNHCRNPNRDVSGSWCYTADPKVVQDVCAVKDCDRPEEFTIITSSNARGRRLYVLPQWKEEGIHGGLRFSLKEWNPDKLSGFAIALYPKDNTSEIVLVIGAELNEKIELYVDQKLIESKTYPHLISAGVWTDFWLQIRKGEIMLGFKGVPTALFEWKQPNMEEAFEPMFLAYYSLFNLMPIGVFFQGECHTENTTDNNFLKYIPVGLYSESEHTAHTNLTLKMRGSGHTWISFMWVTNNLNSYQIKIDTDKNTIGFYKVEAPPGGGTPKILPLTEKVVPDVLSSAKNWTKLYFSWSERVMDVKRNDHPVLTHEQEQPMLFYWFSVAAASGWVTWSANCEPLDLDGPPIDGGWSEWSPWTCTVSCGGGEGFRTRTCSNPYPNIFGRLCEGSPTATGICNDFPCGDLSPTTMDEIHANLKRKAYSIAIDEGGVVLLPNDARLLRKIKKESPEAYYEWTLNGLFVGLNARVTRQGDDVRIASATPADAGVYCSMIYRINGQRVVLKLITLAVKSKRFDVDTRATWSYTLECHAVVLSYVYADLTLKLVLNNATYLDHGLTASLAAVDAHALSPLNETHSGAWQCVVEQNDLRLEWVTNHVKMNVKKRPNFYTHLMEDRLTAPLFGRLPNEEAALALLIVVVLLVIGGVVSFYFVYLKFCTLKARNRRNRRFN